MSLLLSSRVVLVRSSRLISIESRKDWDIRGKCFVRITDIKSFEELASRSGDAPLVVFKHSTTCPISEAAYSEMSSFEGEVALVEVQSAGNLSREIALRTGVVHESPQVIVLRNGKAVWEASHWKVKADAVQQAVKKAANGAVGKEE
jgi:bacillithiol system protein YtxJ